ncbi:MAG: 2-iminobutanoate/2-iminopropanoate deaminase [Alphaproteobacteria bacterium]|jgi:2-iminobutanoate/2-iminopropanoate deaminase|nr:2-iminobutanoate/2-iminopropanoate deaminase [Alphaproteobacteria bacterium]
MRRSIEVAGYKHGNPIPAASRIGNIVMTGVISAKDAQTGKLPDALEAQCAAMFRNVRDIIEAAGGKPEHIIKMTVWLRNLSDRKALNEEWLKMFPDAASRPARHALLHQGEGDSLIVCDFTAVVI